MPVWLGVGQALQWARTDRAFAPVLAEMAAQWPFFRSTLSLVEMVLAKSDVRIASVYSEVWLAAVAWVGWLSGLGWQVLAPPDLHASVGKELHRLLRLTAVGTLTPVPPQAYLP